MLQEGVPALLYAPNFRELRYGEVRRIPLLSTWVNKPLRNRRGGALLRAPLSAGRSDLSDAVECREAFYGSLSPSRQFIPACMQRSTKNCSVPGFHASM